MKMLMMAGVDLAPDDLGFVGDNDSSNCRRRIAEQHTDAEIDTPVLLKESLGILSTLVPTLRCTCYPLSMIWYLITRTGEVNLYRQGYKSSPIWVTFSSGVMYNQQILKERRYKERKVPVHIPWGWWRCLWWLVLTLPLTTSALSAITIRQTVDDVLRSNIRMRSSIPCFIPCNIACPIFSWSRFSCLGCMSEYQLQLFTW